jgi:hypothetical protein
MPGLSFGARAAGADVGKQRPYKQEFASLY